LGLCSHFASEVNVAVIEKYVPEPAVVMNQTSMVTPGSNFFKDTSDIPAIVRRNLFNSKGLLPGQDTEAEEAAPSVDSPATKTNLNITVIGVMVFSHQDLSIASLEDRDSKQTYPVRIGDEIPNRLKVIAIEEGKVIFINTANSRKEYLEYDFQKNVSAMDTLSGLGLGVSAGPRTGPQVISRQEVDLALSDLNNVLTQAKAVPNFEGGKPVGYKLFQIVSGSIFDKLGLKNGDVIVGLNGQPVTDPAKALELLADLKTSNHIEVQLKKDNTSFNYVYDIQ
jgi:general secretion pathway protein C